MCHLLKGIVVPIRMGFYRDVAMAIHACNHSVAMAIHAYNHSILIQALQDAILSFNVVVVCYTGAHAPSSHFCYKQIVAIYI